MSESSFYRAKPAVIFGMFCFLAAVVFGFLWVHEVRDRPREIVVGQTTEDVKLGEGERGMVGGEKPIEVVKQGAAPGFTEDQEAAIHYAESLLRAKSIGNVDDALYKLDSVRVTVFLSDAAKEVVSEDRVRNKFELILRRNGVNLDERANASLNLMVEGAWEKNQTFLVISTRIQLSESVLVCRKTDVRQVAANLWEAGSVGFAGRQIVEGTILESVESLGEIFSNKFLAARDRVK